MTEPPGTGGAPGPQRERWGVLCALSFVAGPVVAALVLRLTAGRSDPWVRHHASEAVNAQLWWAVLWLGPVAVVAALGGRGPGAFLGVGVVVPLASSIGFLVLTATHAVRASQGEWWRYPLPFRVVPGSAP